MDRIIIWLVSTILFLSSAATQATPPPDDADVVNLRKSCTEGGNDIKNCFTTTSSLVNWIYTKNLQNPLLVNIGPGEFGAINCYFKNVTFRGAGRDSTVISGSAWGMNTGPGCDRLNVEDLKIKGGVLWGVLVTNPDELHSTWTNVEIDAKAYAWVETQCHSNNRGEHLWFSSRINVATSQGIARAYTARCGDSWFWGSEISSTVSAGITDSPEAGNAFALNADLNAEVHVYGSNLKLIVDSSKTGHVGGALVQAIAGSEVHIHGTGLDVVSANPSTVMVLNADASSTIHANESSYFLVNPGGSTTRISGAGKIMAPYLWQQSQDAPNVVSKTGADIFIDTSGSKPIMFIYDESCSGAGGKWSDLVTQVCR